MRIVTRFGGVLAVQNETECLHSVSLLHSPVMDTRTLIRGVAHCHLQNAHSIFNIHKTTLYSVCLLLSHFLLAFHSITRGMC